MKMMKVRFWIEMAAPASVWRASWPSSLRPLAPLQEQPPRNPNLGNPRDPPPSNSGLRGHDYRHSLWRETLCRRGHGCRGLHSGLRPQWRELRSGGWGENLYSRRRTRRLEAGGRAARQDRRNSEWRNHFGGIGCRSRPKAERVYFPPGVFGTAAAGPAAPGITGTAGCAGALGPA